MKPYGFGLICTVLVASIAAPAHAQSEFIKETAANLIRKVGVRGHISIREPVDSDVTKGMTFGPSIGLGPGRTGGWKYPIGLTMYSEDLHSPNGEPFATMSSKAILAGIGYNWHFGRFVTGAQLQTGFAFNRGRTDGDMLRAFGAPNGAVSIHVANAPLLRPNVKAEYFITPKFSVRASGDYVLMRPDITVMTPSGRVVNRWDVSNVHASVGVGFYPFRR